MRFKKIIFLSIVIIVASVTDGLGLKTVYDASSDSPETLLVWVDCDVELKSDQLFDLTMSTSSTGARLYGATFSLNRDYIWLLCETTSDKVEGLMSIENVLNVSIAEEGEWQWKHEMWRDHQKISPVLELQAKRMRAEYPDEKIEVDLWFYTSSDEEADLNNTRTLVESLGGNVTWFGLLESEGVGQVLILVPLDAIETLASSDSIRTLQTDGPLIPE